MNYEALGQTKRAVALELKRESGLTLSVLAARIGVSQEAVRIQVNEMIRQGLLTRAPAVRHKRSVGRPATAYRLTSEGQHLFPKRYDALAGALLRTSLEASNPAQRNSLLGRLTDRQVHTWSRRLAHLSVEQRLHRLRDLYFDGDPFTEVVRSDGHWLLVERNCPFLNVALAQPALCDATVELLTRLLGVRVQREEGFQKGGNRCVFRIFADPADSPAAPAPEPAAGV